MRLAFTDGDVARSAYLAGIFDGEGHAGVHHLPSRGNRAYPVATVAMTDGEPVRLFRAVFGGYYRSYKKATVRKRVHVWFVSHRKALAVATALLPWTRNRSKIRQFGSILKHYGVV